MSRLYLKINRSNIYRCTDKQSNTYLSFSVPKIDARYSAMLLVRTTPLSRHWSQRSFTIKNKISTKSKFNTTLFMLLNQICDSINFCNDSLILSMYFLLRFGVFFYIWNRSRGYADKQLLKQIGMCILFCFLGILISLFKKLFLAQTKE